MSYKIIDFHCHIYPDKIAHKAAQAISDFYDTPVAGDGTAEKLLKMADEFNVEKMIVHSTATRFEQVNPINNFIIDEKNKHDKFIGFGTMHPDYPNVEDEFIRVINHGLKGLKIHPDFMEVNADDKSMYQIYELAQIYDLPILFHVGDETKDFSNPIRIKKVLDDFPRLKAIAAHLGGYTVWDESLEIFKGKDIWVDTCSSLPFLNDKKAINIINTYGEDKVLFATDYPMWHIKNELERILSLDLSNNIKHKILYKNAVNLLKIKL